VVPFSFITHQARRGSQRGLEDAIISARYGVDLEGPEAEAWSVRESVEIRPFSVVGYVYLHREGTVERLRGGGSRFAGASAAWTPIDDMDRPSGESRDQAGT